MATPQKTNTKTTAKSTAKKTTTKAAATKKPAASKATAPKATAKKAPATKAASTAAKKTTTSKPAAKKAPARKPATAKPAANSRRRAVIVDGVRTPFVKAFGPLMTMDSIALGTAAVKGLVAKTKLNTNTVDAVVWGGVILPSAAPNLAREIVFDAGLPMSAQGYTVTRACASGVQAITDAVAMIERGEADVVIAGGSDSTSNVGVELPAEITHAFAPVALGKGGPKEILQGIKELYPFKNVLPRKPAIAERTTGELMGESCEKMAEINGISREAQDEFAVRSQHRAAAGFEKGLLNDEVISVTNPEGEVVSKDGLIRGGTSVEKISKLKPAFKEGGTLTAANSSALTDGAACTLIMSEEAAKKAGLKPLAYVDSWQYVGVDPSDQLLIGPAVALPKAIEKAGLTKDDIDFYDFHEAFAAQVLSVLHVLEDDKFCKERIGLSKAFGSISTDDYNLYGGSLAVGHPFGATGARIFTTIANELARSDSKHAAMALCAAGGLGVAAVLSSVD